MSEPNLLFSSLNTEEMKINHDMVNKYIHVGDHDENENMGNLNLEQLVNEFTDNMGDPEEEEMEDDEDFGVENGKVTVDDEEELVSASFSNDENTHRAACLDVSLTNEHIKK